MSKTKLLVAAMCLLIGGAVSAQSLGEQAAALRAKEVKEAEEKANRDAPPKPAPVVKPPPVRRLSFQLHSVINRNGKWFAEVARSNALSAASVGSQFGQARVANINAQGLELVSPPDEKCVKKKEKLKGKKAEAMKCPPVSTFVAVGGYF